jgi:TetR/AcrR family transcriptional repressor of nem operon
MSKADKTRQLIIEQAALIFNEKGIAGTSVDDVLRASKVAKGCLYGHFDSKEELSYACVDYLFGTMTERRTRAFSKHRTARGKIYAFMEMNKTPLNSYFSGGCPIVNFSTESDDTNPVIKRKVKEMLETVISLFTQILQSGIVSGEFSDKLIPEEFAVKMLFTIEGANAICRVLNSNRHMQTVIKSLKSELDSYVLVPLEN